MACAFLMNAVDEIKKIKNKNANKINVIKIWKTYILENKSDAYQQIKRMSLSLHSRP